MRHKTWGAFSGLLLFACGGDVGEATNQLDELGGGGSGRYEEVTINSDALDGNVLGDENQRKVLVYLPPGYDDNNKKFPVVYALAGATGDHRNFAFDGAINRLAAGRPVMLDLDIDILTMVDDLINNQGMSKAIVVGVPGTNSYGAVWSGCSEVIGDWRTFVAEEVVEKIDNRYRTIRTRFARGILGHSSGGHDAVAVAVQYPKTFGALAILGPAQNELDTPGPGGTGLPFAVDRFVAANPTAPGVPIFLTTDGTIPDSEFWAFWGSAPLAGKFGTNIFYSLAAAFSPNPNNPPYYVNLPVIYPEKTLDAAVWALWQPNDTVSFVTTSPENLRFTPTLLVKGTGPTQLQPEPGDIAALRNALNNQGVVHTYEEYPGDHFTVLPTSFPRAIRFVVDNLRTNGSMPFDIDDEVFDQTLSNNHAPCAELFDDD